MATVTQAALAQPPAAGPQIVEGAGQMDDREVKNLQCACVNRHNEKGQVIGTLIGIAALVAGVWSGVMVGGFAGFLLACSIILIGGNSLGSIYNSLRNHDYLDVAMALTTPSFKQFIQRNNLDLSIESIVDVYKKYKENLALQTHNLAPQPAQP